ncbi:hypothetical protein [Caulobacter sp. S45]|uniref:hypothetical protein n=1 Tax=Caulobacter sp. S45 TaxID=1641861 RepID=UPI00131E5F9D|nr:hypothetical protein [Caulobacter sp. S45]
MMRRSGLTLVLATTALAGLAACHPVEHRNPGARIFAERPYKVGDRLDCPSTVEELTRTAQAADGRSCQYSGPRDELVDLTLTALNGRDPTAVLADTQKGLEGYIGAPTGGAGTSGASPSKPDGNKISVHTGDGDGDDHAKIDLPGIHIDADNGKASVRLPGLTVNANNGDAHVRTGWGPYKNMQVDAHDGGAEIHAGDVTDAGAKLFYLLASDTPGPDGYRSVGYMARGPRSGPLVVAVFKEKAVERDHSRLAASGIDALVRLNVRH